MQTEQIPLEERRFLHADKVRELLGYANRSCFWEAVRRAGIPYIKLNQRRFLFDAAEVEAWLKRRTIQGR